MNARRLLLPQLEKAIEVVMQRLEALPVPVPTRPSFPIRVRRPGR